jgi:hypothetical protein
VTELSFSIWTYIYLALVLLGFILSFLNNRITAQVGKSFGCVAFLLENWAIIYVVAYENWYGHLFSISDVWRWYIVVIFTGILAICLLTIWKPFSNRVRQRASFGLALFLILLTAITILTWKDDLPPPDIFTQWIYDDSIFSEAGRIFRETWPTHLMSLMVAFVTFLSFNQNPIASRIGKSAICVFLFLLVAGLWSTTMSIIGMGIFISLFFIWRPYHHALADQ